VVEQRRPLVKIFDINASQNQTGQDVIGLSCPQPRPVWFRLALDMQ
jgi:hypothetical protein